MAVVNAAIPSESPNANPKPKSSKGPIIGNLFKIFLNGTITGFNILDKFLGVNLVFLRSVCINFGTSSTKSPNLKPASKLLNRRALVRGVDTSFTFGLNFFKTKSLF